MSNELTYSESKGITPIDWNHRLAMAEKTSIDDMCTWIEEAANSWITCACGNLCKAIPRDDGGAPLDHELRELGHSFGCNITRLVFAAEEDKRGENFRESLKEASATLAAIEKRSEEILREVLS